MEEQIEMFEMDMDTIIMKRREVEAPNSIAKVVTGDMVTCPEPEELEIFPAAKR